MSEISEDVVMVSESFIDLAVIVVIDNRLRNLSITNGVQVLVLIAVILLDQILPAGLSAVV